MHWVIILLVLLFVVLVIVYICRRKYYLKSTLTEWQGIQNNLVTPILLTIEDTNIHHIKSPTTQIEIPKSGEYELKMGVTWSAGSISGTRYLILLKNGKNLKSVENQQIQTNCPMTQTFSCFETLEHGDILTLNVYQNTGGVVQLIPNNFQSTEWTWFQLREL